MLPFRHCRPNGYEQWQPSENRISLIDESVRKIRCEAFTARTQGVGFFLRDNEKPRYVNGI